MQELEGGIYTQSDNASRHYDVEFGFYDLLRPFFQCQQRKQQIVHVNKKLNSSLFHQSNFALGSSLLVLSYNSVSDWPCNMKKKVKGIKLSV